MTPRETFLQTLLRIGGKKIKHTEEKVRTVEDLHQAIEHYRWLYKYNLA